MPAKGHISVAPWWTTLCMLSVSTTGKSSPPPKVPVVVGGSLPLSTTLLLLLYPFNGLFSRTTWVSRYQKNKTSLDLKRQKITEFSDGSGISWTICKQSAPHSRQITMPTPHHSVFTGQMLFPTPNQQCLSTEGVLSPLFRGACVSSCNTWLIHVLVRPFLWRSPMWTHGQKHTPWNIGLTTGCIVMQHSNDCRQTQFIVTSLISTRNNTGLINPLLIYWYTRPHPHRGWSCQVPKTAEITLF